MPHSPLNELISKIADRVDAGGPIPVYHQIATAIGHEIATGRLGIGAPLPSLRECAEGLGVHYHTIRAAYDSLVRDGIVRSRQGRGTVVIRAPATRAATGQGEVLPVWVAGPSLLAGTQLAQSIVAQWQVIAAPWPMHGAPPPPGPILCPKEIEEHVRTQWPDRELDVHGLELDADASTLSVIRRNADLLAVRRVRLVASDDPAERRVLQQLTIQVPRLGLQVVVGDTPTPPDHDDGLSCYSPSAWQAMPWEDRSHPRALALEFRFAAGPVARVARQLQWRAL